MLVGIGLISFRFVSSFCCWCDLSPAWTSINSINITIIEPVAWEVIWQVVLAGHLCCDFGDLHDDIMSQNLLINTDTQVLHHPSLEAASQGATKQTGKGNLWWDLHLKFGSNFTNIDNISHSITLLWMQRGNLRTIVVMFSLQSSLPHLLSLESPVTNHHLYSDVWCELGLDNNSISINIAI